MEAKNTANELVKDLNQRDGIDNFIKRLKISDKDRHILITYIQLEKYVSEKNGYNEGKSQIQKSILDLLDIRKAMDEYNEFTFYK